MFLQIISLFPPQMAGYPASTVAAAEQQHHWGILKLDRAHSSPREACGDSGESVLQSPERLSWRTILVLPSFHAHSEAFTSAMLNPSCLKFATRLDVLLVPMYIWNFLTLHTWPFPLLNCENIDSNINLWNLLRQRFPFPSQKSYNPLFVHSQVTGIQAMNINCSHFRMYTSSGQVR